MSVWPQVCKMAKNPSLAPRCFGLRAISWSVWARGTEQEIVDDPGVLKRERREQLRDREDHVRVGYRQHLGLASFEPGLLGAALTLRTVAVPARVVGDPLVSAGVARIDVAAQARRPARGDPLDDRTLLPAPWWTATLALRSQIPLIALEDLRDLVPRSLGHYSGLASTPLNASNGLRVPRSRSVATWV